MKTIGAKHILVEHEYEARDILKKLEEGKSFEDLAKDFSICPSARNGGNLGVFPLGKMIKTFEEAVLEIDIDEISPIVKTRFGYHIIKRTD